MSMQIAIGDLVKLQTWFSPAFPVGAFGYSHGLEWVIETGEVCNAHALAAWIEAVIRYGAGRSDLILVCAMWRAVSLRDWPRAKEIGALSVALQPTLERRLESVGQGTAFVRAITAGWSQPALRTFCEATSGEFAMPAAVGLAAAAHGLPLGAVLVACLHAFASNLVSVGVRLIPLGQTDGLRTLAILEPAVVEVSRDAQQSVLEDLGSAALLADIASMRHDTQYSRLFLS
jgi:urease accessory protein